MDRPDTVIEINRLYIQKRTAEAYGEKRTVSASLTDKLWNASASLEIKVDGVWFVNDSRGRLWQERALAKSSDPTRHYAIDLLMSDSVIQLKSINCVRLPQSGPKVIEIPDGPKKGQTLHARWNEIPLFGRLTIHDQIEPRPASAGIQTIALNFHRAPAPLLVATDDFDEFGPKLYGVGVERSPGWTTFQGADPRVTWDLEYHEAYWITHCPAGERVVESLKGFLRLRADQARERFLELIAAKMAERVIPEVAKLGDHGVLPVLPKGVPVDSTGQRLGTFAEVDAVVLRTPDTRGGQESLVVQLRSHGDVGKQELPRSVLADRPGEHIALAVTGWSFLRQIREMLATAFDLTSSDFADQAPCALANPKTICLGGIERTLRAMRAEITNDASTSHLLIELDVDTHTERHDFGAEISLRYVLAHRPSKPGASLTGSRTLEAIRLDARTAAQQRRDGVIDGTGYEEELSRANEMLNLLPEAGQIVPQLAAEPEVRHDCRPTESASASVNDDVPSASDESTIAEYGEALAGAVKDYVTAVIRVGWLCYGAGIALDGDWTGGSTALLSPENAVVDVTLGPERLVVFFRN